MIDIIKFTIPGEPQGKARPRATRTKRGVRTYTPDKTVAYEELVRLKFSELHQPPLEGEVSVRITAYYAIPQSAAKKRKALMECNLIRPMKKPARWENQRFTKVEGARKSSIVTPMPMMKAPT